MSHYSPLFGEKCPSHQSKFCPGPFQPALAASRCFRQCSTIAPELTSHPNNQQMVDPTPTVDMHTCTSCTTISWASRCWNYFTSLASGPLTEHTSVSTLDRQGVEGWPPCECRSWFSWQLTPFFPLCDWGPVPGCIWRQTEHHVIILLITHHSLLLSKLWLGYSASVYLKTEQHVVIIYHTSQSSSLHLVVGPVL